MSVAPKAIILAALPREVRALVRGVAPDAQAKARGVLLYRLPGAIVATAGMGAARVSLAFDVALSHGTPESVYSVGLAGACTSAYPPGSVAEAGTVVDVRTGERFTAATGAAVILASGEAIASVAEKARLAAAYGAGLVDMEAATVARLAEAHSLPFRAIKGISDAHDFELASVGRFATPQGQFRTAAFALHTALRPAQWSTAATLGRHSKQALQALQQRLQEILA